MSTKTKPTPNTTSTTALDYPPARAAVRGTPWIMQVPVITTAHFPKEDCDKLFAEPLFETPGGEPIGVVLHIEDLAENVDLDALTEPSVRLLKQFRQLGYAYLRIDRDGDTLPHVPTFNW